ncbi:sulfolactaldehyde 3-reductase, partial [Candidatus Aerophobetes bacterium]|nr:sulfolactaldehyde 3-reductase [Candidatus Aerophobetes bacterium]
MKEKAKVGFIGLGTMGFPMAEKVLEGGYPLVGYDISPQR